MPRGSLPRRWRPVGVVARRRLPVLGLGGSADDHDRRPVAAEAAAPLRVDLIDDAIAAVEAELGGPQDYFEINATPALVNLFVARRGDGTCNRVRVPRRRADLGGARGDGGRARPSARDALDFDPATVTRCVDGRAADDSRQDVFEVLGGPEGTVVYSVIVTSAAGGQLRGHGRCRVDRVARSLRVRPDVREAQRRADADRHRREPSRDDLG